MKTVLYTQRVEFIESYGEIRDCADRRIPGFIHDCGYLPIPLPNEISIVKSIVNKIPTDGIVLVGGNSLVKYGGNSPERDEVDRFLISHAIDKKIPLLGFCRGMQSILDYFNCDLEQITGHVATRHLIKSDNNSYEVNSFHNQGCKRLKDGCGLICKAFSEDGVIEEISHVKYEIKGIMWHPEREKVFKEIDKKFFRNLFN